MQQHKIKSYYQIQEIASHYRVKEKSVGLITGCFDVLHIGHLNFFNSAKKYVDKLIVGLENDETIKKSKGNQRPINTQDIRSTFLSELNTVDSIFIIKDEYEFNDLENAEKVHTEILKLIAPDYIFSNSKTDNYWEIKKTRAEKHNIKIVMLEHEYESSTSKILEHLLKEL